MKIGVVGSGGREAAIIWALHKDPRIEKIYALPGNGGIEALATCLPVSATDVEGVIKAAEEHAMDFVVVTPDDPLALGMVDALQEKGIAAFGPTKAAARLESSKAYAKELMQKYHIPTAGFKVFDDEEEALAYIQQCPLPTVVKASGLALGKGVIICQTREEAADAVRKMMGEEAFGKSGKTIVIEEFMEGPEISVLAFTDGTIIKPLVSSMDHKRALDGDEGPNTGGMGCIAPNPFYSEELAQRCQDEIFLPTIEACKKEGHPFRGCLFFGLMLTDKGPKVLEYNCRFGDPETETVLPLLKSNLLDILLATESDNLADVPVENLNAASCCVVLASKGYPVAYEKGFEIKMPMREGNWPGNCGEHYEARFGKNRENSDGESDGENSEGTANSDSANKTQEEFSEGEQIFVAGAKKEGGRLLTNGGRVIDVVAQAPTLEGAIQKAYKLAEEITFEGAMKRLDIGQKALKAIKR